MTIHQTILRQLALTVTLALVFSTAATAASTPSSKLWELLSSGDHFAMIRHALAPGFGDPDHFDVNDCSTQRNLSDTGRDQAASIGALFRQNGIQQARVYSSQWCRCRETAELMDLGKVSELPSLNSFFQDYAKEEPQTQALRTWLSQRDLSVPTILVTHQVNIRAMVNESTSSGEIVFVRRLADGSYRKVGAIATH